jgi:hypothetical protein
MKSVGESAQIVEQQPARRLERAAAASGPALDQVEWYALAGELDGVFMAELVWREAASDERGLDAP